MDICQNYAYDTFVNQTHGCNCQTGWTGQFCNASLFQIDDGRMLGFNIFTGICSGYCGLLIIVSLYFIREHYVVQSNKKDMLAPGIVGLGSLWLLLFMSVNPLGQRFPYSFPIFIFQSLWINLAIAFTVCALAFIISNWLTVAYIARGDIKSRTNWNTKVKILFFVLCTIVLSSALLTTGLGLFISLSTEFFLATILLVTFVLSILLLVSAISIFKFARIRNNSTSASCRGILFAVFIVLAIIILVGIFVIRFFFKDSWELVFVFGLIIPATILCFIQSIVLSLLRYKDHFTTDLKTPLTDLDISDYDEKSIPTPENSKFVVIDEEYDSEDYDTGKSVFEF